MSIRQVPIELEMIPDLELSPVDNGLRYYRRAMGYTLREVSEGTGLSFNFISEIERGRKVPSVLNAIKLSCFYRVPIERLFPVAIRVDDGNVEDRATYAPMIDDIEFISPASDLSSTQT